MPSKKLREVDAVQPEESLDRGAEVARLHRSAVGVADPPAQLEAIRLSAVGQGWQVPGQIGDERRAGRAADLPIGDEPVVENGEVAPCVGLPCKRGVEAAATGDIRADDEGATAVARRRRERGHPDRAVTSGGKCARAAPQLDRIRHLRGLRIEPEDLAGRRARYPNRTARGGDALDAWPYRPHLRDRARPCVDPGDRAVLRVRDPDVVPNDRDPPRTVSDRNRLDDDALARIDLTDCRRVAARDPDSAGTRCERIGPAGNTYNVGLDSAPRVHARHGAVQHVRHPYGSVPNRDGAGTVANRDVVADDGVGVGTDLGECSSGRIRDPDCPFSCRDARPAFLARG